MKTILVLVVLAILVICAWNGYKKGLIMGIGGVIVVIVSLYGGALLSETFSYEVVPALKPFAGGYIESRTPKVLYEMLGYEPDENGNYNVVFSVDDLLGGDYQMTHELCENVYKSLGIYSSTAEVLADETMDYMADSGAEVRDSLSHVACMRLTYAAGLMLGFLLIAIILTVIGNLPNFSFKIPYLGLFNDISGAVMGLIKGIMLCAVLIWAIKFLGIIIPEETTSETFIAGWFLEKDYLLRYLGL